MRWCGALAVSLAVAAPAAAQDDAPKVAPDSPAGTEYQLPVDHARNAGSGGGSSHSSATPGGAPLFGAGVEGGNVGTGHEAAVRGRRCARADEAAGR